ncbi:endoplasmic reticulum-Golgi intermediate compartment protein 1 [Pteropus vampyrus]|uniref:Endoplasmic reticulum-Golgi intermediate compartment protein n=1 Tax=Pteropus vampyrus TaxID=132908 RepID=A0A6P6CZG9_PTEVA|nr:endoplasmic reticulum-Golgi intermediate compartment protein 1 [Pteropus vampyrus]
MPFDFRRFDIYRKVPKDLTQPTYTGAIISICCCVFILFLFLSELTGFLTTEVVNELYVDDPDKDSGGKIDVSLNISLPNLHCELVGLDIQDEMGRHEVGHIDNSMKIPLNGGAGCRFEGQFSINKVPGNFHVSTHSATAQPQNPDMTHVIHKLSFGDTLQVSGTRSGRHGWGWTYKGCVFCLPLAQRDALQRESPALSLCSITRPSVLFLLKEATVSSPYEMRGGPAFSDVELGPEKPLVQGPPADLSNSTVQPTPSPAPSALLLSAHCASPASPRPVLSAALASHDYILKIVPTVYEDKSGKQQYSYQYTVANKEYVAYSHTGRIIPAIWFRYDLSPITVKYTERRQPLYRFITTICAIIGGTFTVAGILDSCIFTASEAWRKIQLGKMH